MLDVGVDAAVAEQTHQVQGGALFPAGGHGVEIGGVFKKAPVGDGVGDARQVLENHAAGADVGMPNLTVAHLPGGQAHVQSGGLQGGGGIFGEQLVQTRRGGGADGVALHGVGQAEAVP
jgi:hypothetical protein